MDETGKQAYRLHAASRSHTGEGNQGSAQGTRMAGQADGLGS